MSALEPGDLVLGRLRGYTAWPVVVIDPNSLSRTPRARQPRRPVYAVRFFPVGNQLGVVDHEWLKKCAKNPLNKQRGLLNGYKAALLETEAIGNRFIRKGHPCEMIDPQALKVRKWRHELQKIFLSGVLPNSGVRFETHLRALAHYIV
ncbi:hypothetical protein B0H14DRAFT_2572482 [Mycena olivaceomarginata]|nr:hypothetical protein B0H14DRAFT_2572482 [Mycena olivaceomarginata]